ncbi:hypothetical protein N7522_005039 [Penicillium canescens]|nr:hypothetical protein N7522_005039 [Penicillium canescens]
MTNFEQALDEQEGAMSTPEHNRVALVAPDSSSSIIQPLPPDESFFPETNDFHIPDSVERLAGCSHNQILEKIYQIQERFKEDEEESTQYLLITDAQEDLQAKLFERKIAGARATVSGQRILFRIMPGSRHERLVSNLSSWFVLAMQAAGIPMDPSIWMPTGATPKTGRFCGKEPDYGIVPGADYGMLPPSEYDAETDGIQLEEAWPSMVMEAGYTQSSRSFRATADWWYRNSGRRTKLILLFELRRIPTFSVHIQLWQEVSTPHTGRTLRSAAASPLPQVVMPRLECTHSTYFARDHDPAPITLDYSQLMREPLPDGRSNVILTSHMLRQICRPSM